MLSITKLQNLKAIHNPCTITITEDNVVINHKTTKFESNSQLKPSDTVANNCCYQSQNYKIWKQFTTIRFFFSCSWKLLSITKLQNLKAIHNAVIQAYISALVVINHKTTKFESNSQHSSKACVNVIGCYQSQNYKIWKQFTTRIRDWNGWDELLSITKLQNLKAIHNTWEGN